MLFPAPVDLLLGLELLEQLLCVFTLAAEAIDLHAQVLQRCAAWVPPLSDGAEDLITR